MSTLKEVKEDILMKQKEKNSLDPQLVGLIHLKTLYLIDQNLWNIYDQQWIKFESEDKFKAPIPPNSKTLVLHLYKNNEKTKNNLLESYLEAKRRL